MNKDVLSTLFVGIDVSSSSNYFCAINFEGKHILDFSITNDLPSSEIAVERIFIFPLTYYLLSFLFM